jgi:ABC-2 type transport system permease protein
LASVQTVGLDRNTEGFKQFKGLYNQSLWRSIWSGSLTVLWGDWLNLRVRIYQVIASGLVSPLIYILAFGFGLGSTIRGSGGFEGNYLEFILPGMVALSSMTISFGGTTFSICGDRLYKKNL